MNYATLGGNIRRYRRQRNITQERLAEMVSLSPVFISQIENAKGKPSLETVVNIANALNISIDVLVNDTTQQDQPSGFIDVSLTQEQLNTISFAFKKRNAKEISALLRAFTYLLDFDK